LFRGVRLLIGMGLCSAAVMSQPGSDIDLVRAIYKELIEIDTTDATGDNTKAAEAMAARLLAAGFPEQDVRVIGPHPQKGNLVARFRGTGERRPILLLAHLDVVDARREDWSFDPFVLTEHDGYFYGRGTIDDKAMAAIWIETFIRLKQEGFHPRRDLIVALTADEEGGRFNGVEWLLQNHRDLIDAEFCLNEGANGQLKSGKPLLLGVQASEKMYQTFAIEVRNRGGHSSRPRKDNAIYILADGLRRLEAYDFPARLDAVTRAYYAAAAELYSGQVGADMAAAARPRPDRKAIERLSESAYDNALLRTTCVATRLEAGHADNALPQTARATVNCRILPGDSPDEVHRALARIMDDSRIAVRPLDEARPSPPSPLAPEILSPIEQTAAHIWPGVPVVPVMSTGATDGAHLRRAGIPTYGVSGLFGDVGDDRAHGKDERLGVRQFYEGREFLYRLVQAFSK